jgi:hypothetical protein
MHLVQNPFTIDTSRLPLERILDRTAELEKLKLITISRRENVFITGQDGIGKTCLLRKLRDQVSRQSPKGCLLVELEMLGMGATPDRFLSDLLLKLFSVVYTSFTGKPFSSLVHSASVPRELPVSFLPVVKHLIELYRVVSSKTSSSEVKDGHRIGANLGVSAEKKEDIGRNWTAGELRPGELMLITYELLEILGDKGVSQVLVFGDEANHVSQDIQVTLYRGNFDAFCARNLQFVFTGNPSVFEEVPHFHELFPNVVEVTGFKDASALDELIDINCGALAVSGVALSYRRDARELIWKITSGNPREIQRVCRVVTDIAIQGGDREVSPEIVMRGCLEAYDFVPKRLPIL